MSEKINVLIGANIEGLKTALAESGKSLSDFGTLAQQAPKKAKTAVDELNQTVRPPFFRKYSSNIFIKEDLPLPHSPSTDKVRGGCVC